MRTTAPPHRDISKCRNKRRCLGVLLPSPNSAAVTVHHTSEMSQEGADAATIRTRTLTNLYNRRPAWLGNAHAALDRAVWAAYGRDDPDPAAVPGDEVLARLLALNLERAGRS